MTKWQMKSIKHSGTCGERMRERQEPYYLARNNCKVEFDYDELKVGQPAVLYYSPKEENHGNGILTSIVTKKLGCDKEYCSFETENSIFILKRLE